jgi:septal ring factor EnvC (AmiA/AmiB activator)
MRSSVLLSALVSLFLSACVSQDDFEELDQDVSYLFYELEELKKQSAKQLNTINQQNSSFSMLDRRLSSIENQIRAIQSKTDQFRVVSSSGSVILLPAE